MNLARRGIIFGLVGGGMALVEWATFAVNNPYQQSVDGRNLSLRPCLSC